MIKVHRNYSALQFTLYMAVLLLWGAAILMSQNKGYDNDNAIRRNNQAKAELHLKRDAIRQEFIKGHVRRVQERRLASR